MRGTGDEVQTLAYGSWRSPIDASLAAAHDGHAEFVGVVDVEDCAAVALALADEGTADRDRLAIRGGSAGGWTTAASLATTDVYACGTILYPILDLSGWGSGETHDFESRYLETLVGPLAEVPGRYAERSPAEHADRVTAPFLLLQGLDLLRGWDLDPVVAPHVLGRHPGFDYLAGTDAERAADLQAAWCDPAVEEFGFGRGEGALTIPFGVGAELDSDTGTLTLDEPALA